MNKQQRAKELKKLTEQLLILYANAMNEKDESTIWWHKNIIDQQHELIKKTIFDNK